MIVPHSESSGFFMRSSRDRCAASRRMTATATAQSCSRSFSGRRPSTNESRCVSRRRPPGRDGRPIGSAVHRLSRQPKRTRSIMAQPFTLPPLPYAEGALAPVISAQTHRLSLRKAPQDLRRQSEQACRRHRVRGAVARGDHQRDRGQGGQGADLQQRRADVEPHVLLEQSEAGRRRQAAEGALAQKIDAAFGGYDKFKTEFADAAVTQFGSGWAWLVADGGALKLVKTAMPKCRSPRGRRRC